MTIQTVHVNNVTQVWPQVEGFIGRALKYSGGDYTLDQIKLLCGRGDWLLIVSVDGQKIKGAMTVSFLNNPNDRVAYVTATGGTGIISREALEELKKIVWSFGATKIQAGGRPAMVRMLSRLGFKERYMVVETEI